MKQEKNPQVRVVFNGEMKDRFEAVKKHYGMQNNADVIRLLVTEEFEKLGFRLPKPRFDHFNLGEEGVKITDDEIHQIVDIYFRREGIYCNYDNASDCEHIKFALTVPEIQRVVRARKRDGWKLPDI